MLLLRPAHLSGGALAVAQISVVRRAPRLAALAGRFVSTHDPLHPTGLGRPASLVGRVVTASKIRHLTDVSACNLQKYLPCNCWHGPASAS